MVATIFLAKIVKNEISAHNCFQLTTAGQKGKETLISGD